MSYEIINTFELNDFEKGFKNELEKEVKDPTYTFNFDKVDAGDTITYNNKYEEFNKQNDEIKEKNNEIINNFLKDATKKYTLHDLNKDFETIINEHFTNLNNKEYNYTEYDKTKLNKLLTELKKLTEANKNVDLKEKLINSELIVKLQNEIHNYISNLVQNTIIKSVEESLPIKLVNINDKIKKEQNIIQYKEKYDAKIKQIQTFYDDNLNNVNKFLTNFNLINFIKAKHPTLYNTINERDIKVKKADEIIYNELQKEAKLQPGTTIVTKRKKSLVPVDHDIEDKVKVSVDVDDNVASINKKEVPLSIVEDNVVIPLTKQNKKKGSPVHEVEENITPRKSTPRIIQVKPQQHVDDPKTNSALHNRIRELTSDINYKNAEIIKLINETNAQKEALTKEHADYEILRRTTNANKNLEDEINKLKKKIEDLTRQINKLNKKIDELNNKIAEKEKKIKELEEAGQNAQSIKEELTKLNEQKNELTKEISGLKQTKNKVNAKLKQKATIDIPQVQQLLIVKETELAKQQEELKSQEDIINKNKIKILSQIKEKEVLKGNITKLKDAYNEQTQKNKQAIDVSLQKNKELANSQISGLMKLIQDETNKFKELQTIFQTNLDKKIALVDEIKKIENEKTNKKKELDEITQKFDVLFKELNSKNAEKDSLTEEVKQLTNKKKELEIAITTKEVEKEKKNKELNDLNAEMSSIQSNIVDKQTELNKITDRTNEELNKMVDKIINEKLENAKKEGDVELKKAISEKEEELNKSMEKINKENAELKAELKQINNLFNSTTENLGEYEQENKNAKQKITELENENIKKSEELGETNKKKNELEQTILVTNNELRAIKQKSEILEQELSTNANKNEELTKRLEEANQQQNKLSGELINIINEKEELTQQLNNANQQQIKIEEQIKIFEGNETEINRLKEELKQKEGEKQLLLTQLSGTDEKQKELEKKLLEIKTETDRAKTELEEANKTTKNLTNELKEVKLQQTKLTKEMQNLQIDNEEKEKQIKILTDEKEKQKIELEKIKENKQAELEALQKKQEEQINELQSKLDENNLDKNLITKDFLTELLLFLLKKCNPNDQNTNDNILLDLINTNNRTKILELFNDCREQKDLVNQILVALQFTEVLIEINFNELQQFIYVAKRTFNNVLNPILSVLQKNTQQFVESGITQLSGKTSDLTIKDFQNMAIVTFDKLLDKNYLTKQNTINFTKMAIEYLKNKDLTNPKLLDNLQSTHDFQNKALETLEALKLKVINDRKDNTQNFINTSLDAFNADYKLIKNTQKDNQLANTNDFVVKSIDTFEKVSDNDFLIKKNTKEFVNIALENLKDKIDNNDGFQKTAMNTSLDDIQKKRTDLIKHTKDFLANSVSTFSDINNPDLANINAKIQDFQSTNDLIKVAIQKFNEITEQPKKMEQTQVLDNMIKTAIQAFNKSARVIVPVATTVSPTISPTISTTVSRSSSPTVSRSSSPTVPVSSSPTVPVSSSPTVPVSRVDKIVNIASTIIDGDITKKISDIGIGLDKDNKIEVFS